jgi:hypothetical protein
MLRDRRILAFRWLLPSAQLLFCAVILWPLLPVLRQRVKDSFHAYGGKRNPPLEVPESQGLIVPVSPPGQLNFETFERLERREWIPQALNLPCSLVQLPYIVLNPAKHEWLPRGMDFETWRVITWPLVGILFWWIGGRGVDALIAARGRVIRPRITWSETIAGAALCAFCAVAAICMPLFSGPDEDFPMRLFVAAFAMWSVLGGIVVIARVAQWRLRKPISGTQEVSPAVPA